MTRAGSITRNAAGIACAGLGAGTDRVPPLRKQAGQPLLTNEGQHPGTITTASQVLDFITGGFQASGMRLPGQAREYVRACMECGYEWRVPRSAAQRRIRSISMFSVAPRGRTVDRAELGREVGAISAEGRVTETFRHCPKCGAEHFRQSPSRGTLPDRPNRMG